MWITDGAIQTIGSLFVDSADKNIYDYVFKMYGLLRDHSDIKDSALADVILYNVESTLDPSRVPQLIYLMRDYLLLKGIHNYCSSQLFLIPVLDRSSGIDAESLLEAIASRNAELEVLAPTADTGYVRILHMPASVMSIDSPKTALVPITLFDAIDQSNYRVQRFEEFGLGYRSTPTGGKRKKKKTVPESNRARPQDFVNPHVPVTHRRYRLQGMAPLSRIVEHPIYKNMKSPTGIVFFIWGINSDLSVVTKRIIIRDVGIYTQEQFKDNVARPTPQTFKGLKKHKSIDPNEFDDREGVFDDCKAVLISYHNTTEKPWTSDFLFNQNVIEWRYDLRGNQAWRQTILDVRKTQSVQVAQGFAPLPLWHMVLMRALHAGMPLNVKYEVFAYRCSLIGTGLFADPIFGAQVGTLHEISFVKREPPRASDLVHRLNGSAPRFGATFTRDGLINCRDELHPRPATFDDLMDFWIGEKAFSDGVFRNEKWDYAVGLHASTPGSRMIPDDKTGFNSYLVYYHISPENRNLHHLPDLSKWKPNKDDDDDDEIMIDESEIMQIDTFTSLANIQRQRDHVLEKGFPKTNGSFVWTPEMARNHPEHFDQYMGNEKFFGDDWASLAAAYIFSMPKGPSKDDYIPFERIFSYQKKQSEDADLIRSFDVFLHSPAWIKHGDLDLFCGSSFTGKREDGVPTTPSTLFVAREMDPVVTRNNQDAPFKKLSAYRNYFPIARTLRDWKDHMLASAELAASASNAEVASSTTIFSALNPGLDGLVQATITKNDSDGVKKLHIDYIFPSVSMQDVGLNGGTIIQVMRSLACIGRCHAVDLEDFSLYHEVYRGYAMPIPTSLVTYWKEGKFSWYESSGFQPSPYADRKRNQEVSMSIAFDVQASMHVDSRGYISELPIIGSPWNTRAFALEIRNRDDLNDSVKAMMTNSNMAEFSLFCKLLQQKRAENKDDREPSMDILGDMLRGDPFMCIVLMRESAESLAEFERLLAPDVSADDFKKVAQNWLKRHPLNKIFLATAIVTMPVEPGMTINSRKAALRLGMREKYWILPLSRILPGGLLSRVRPPRSNSPGIAPV